MSIDSAPLRRQFPRCRATRTWILFGERMVAQIGLIGLSSTSPATIPNCIANAPSFCPEQALPAPLRLVKNSRAMPASGDGTTRVRTPCVETRPRPSPADHPGLPLRRERGSHAAPTMHPHRAELPAEPRGIHQTRARIGADGCRSPRGTRPRLPACPPAHLGGSWVNRCCGRRRQPCCWSSAMRARDLVAGRTGGPPGAGLPAVGRRCRCPALSSCAMQAGTPMSGMSRWRVRRRTLRLRARWPMRAFRVEWSA